MRVSIINVAITGIALHHGGAPWRARGVGQVCRLGIELPVVEQARQANESGTFISYTACPVRRLARMRARHDRTLLCSAPGP